MITIPVSDEMVERAKIRAEEMGRLNNSITAGEGNIAGFIGEAVAAEYLGMVEANTYDYDLSKDGTKIDVKTKRTSVEPRPNYDCSVAAVNDSQDCDYYVFVRVAYDMRTAWLLGYMPSKEYFEVATFLKKGEHDLSNDFTVRSSCYNLKISSLKPLEELRAKVANN